jgi:hypothetical protein
VNLKRATRVIKISTRRPGQRRTSRQVQTEKDAAVFSHKYAWRIANIGLKGISESRVFNTWLGNGRSRQPVGGRSGF